MAYVDLHTIHQKTLVAFIQMILFLHTTNSTAVITVDYFLIYRSYRTSP